MNNIETCELCGKDFPTKETGLVVYICNGCKDNKIGECEDCGELYGNEEHGKETGTCQRNKVCRCGASELSAEHRKKDCKNPF